jgi:hypothetical protein
MTEAGPPRDQRVGYGRPPIEHQFKKGISGNPRGRPKRKKAAGPKDPLKFSTQPANQCLLEEAYRPVLIREGDRTIQLPTIQAVFRSMGVSAMKGNRFAQRHIAELVQQLENNDRELRIEQLRTLIEYKCDGEQVIRAAKARGVRPPDIVPHPDDIFIDFERAEACVCGPMTKEEKAEFDCQLELRDNLQRAVSRAAVDYCATRNSRKREKSLGFWKSLQRSYDKLNDNFPRRYRKDLEDRCWEPGASRPGDQKQRHWPNERSAG